MRVSAPDPFADTYQAMIAARAVVTATSLGLFDALADDLGADRDVIAYFNLAHHLTPEQNAGLAHRAHDALRADGWLVVGDTERVPPGEPPSMVGALSGLLYYASSGTRNYTSAEVEGWLRDAGFAEVDIHRNASSPWRLVFLARRA